MKIILIMGLPGAGKTTLANELARKKVEKDKQKECQTQHLN